MKRLCILILFFISIIASTFSYAISYVGANVENNFANWNFRTIVGNSHFSLHGTNGGLLGGYGVRTDADFYMGGEVFANFHSISTSTRTIAGTTYQAKMKHGVGLSFIPGHYIFSATQIFLRLGVINSQFAILPDNDQRNVWGVQYGLGVQAQVIKRLEARLECIYSNYRFFKNDAETVKVFPQNKQVNFGIIYKIT